MVQSATPALHRSNALARLRNHVPGAKASFDQLVGTPRFLVRERGFLTEAGGAGAGISPEHFQGVAPADPHRVVKAFLNAHAGMFGHDASALSNAVVERDAEVGPARLRTTIWRQQVDGIPVFDGVFVAHQTREEALVALSSRFVAEPEKAAARGTPGRKFVLANPPVTARQAIRIAADDLGCALKESELVLVVAETGPRKAQRFRGTGLRGETPARLTWVPVSADALRLCWEVIVWPTDQLGRYRLLVDAQTGEVLVRHCLTVAQRPVTYNVFTNDSPSPFTPGWSEPSFEQPPTVSRSMVTLSSMSRVGSPAGWVTEGEVLTTSGNNAVAFVDMNLDLVPDVAPPSVTNRVFDFPLDLTQSPLMFPDAAVVQLFYDANWFHDVMYDLGFNEPLGNYQKSNFGRGGFENDPVICLAWGVVNNAFFYPDYDGFPGYCVMGIFTGPEPYRDSCYDQEIVFHELTHGVSMRVVGGGLALNSLQSSGLGEGWSDFFPMRLLSQPTDDPDACYPIGGYSSYMLGGYNFENYYFGIRRYPYSTDTNKNPLTFKDIDPVQADPHLNVPINPLVAGGDPSEEHNQGEFWAVVLHEIWAGLVKEWGWHVGNNLAMQLVFYGMVLTPPEPTYLEARDAIILADDLLTGGQNYVVLWRAFAKRGLGYSAVCPLAYTTRGVVEAFDMPPDAPAGVPDGFLEMRVVPGNGSAVIAGQDEVVYVTLTDAVGVPNATVVGSYASANVTFRNDGIQPDQAAFDKVYTATIKVPQTASNLVLTIVATAPGKYPLTNQVTYLVVAPPPNDHFTNATKLSGTVRLITNNKLATMEQGEPRHAGVPSVARSLWWTYSSPTNATVLIDAGGSQFLTVLAVYTNNQLQFLAPVAAAVGSATRKGPYLYLNAKAGVTYRIAVAGYDPTNCGSINLSVIPGGRPDTNAPVVTISSPLSGTIFTTNVITVSGTAADSGADPSGIESVWVAVLPRFGQAITNRLMPVLGAFSGPQLTNWAAPIGLQPGLNKIIVWAEDCAGNVSPTVSAEVTYRVLDPPNDFFVNAIPLACTSNMVMVSTVNATREEGEPAHAGVIGGKSVWYSFTAPADGQLELSTTNSGFDTVLAVYTGDSVTALTPVASNDDAYEGAPGGFSRVVLGVRSNQTYRIAIDGYDGASGLAFLTYAFSEARICTVDVVAGEGGSVELVWENAQQQLPASVPAGATVRLTAQPVSEEWQFAEWSGDYYSPVNPAILTIDRDMAISAVFKPRVYTDGFESGGFSTLPWVVTGPNTGNAPWIVQTNVVRSGRFAARSGIITHNQRSSLILTNRFRTGVGTFWYKVSSEAGYDVLEFFIDGAPVPLLRVSGEIDWTVFSFPITNGIHVLEWRYSKDAAVSVGLDAAFIDNLDLPLWPVPDQTAPARLRLSLTSDGNCVLDVAGQLNQYYVTEYSPDLRHWYPMSTNIALGGAFRVFDPARTGTNQMRFYRVVSPTE